MGKLIPFRRAPEPDLSLREILDGLEGDVDKFTKIAADAYRAAASCAANGDRVGVATARANAEAALVVVREAFELLAAASDEAI